MRQSIKTGVLERRAERKALYALIATCEKENIIKALEIIEADKNHYHAAHHYYKPFYLNLYKDLHLKSLISFSNINNKTALNFLAFHYLRGTLDDIATFITKINNKEISIEFDRAEMTKTFFKLLGIAACEHLAKENKIDALPNLTIKDLYLRPITNHEFFNGVPIDARHFSQLTELHIKNDFRYLQFFDPSKLVALKELYLSDIKISDALYFIEALPNLKKLYYELDNYDGWEKLKSNSLTSLTLDVMSHNGRSYDYLPDFTINLPNLTRLNLKWLKLNNTDNLAKLQKLEDLQLVTIRCPQEQLVIPPLPLLQYLDLYRMNNLDVASISLLHNLTQLEIKYCNMKDLSFLANLTNLKYLDIEDSKVTDIAALSQLEKLVKLNLSNNNITDVSALSQLKNLVKLNLSYNNITDIAALSQLENLVKLDLRNNNITDISALEGLNKLREIDLLYNTLAVYPPLRTSIWIQRYVRVNLFQDLEEPQEVTSLRALIRSGDKNNIAIAEQILFGMGWTKSEFHQLVSILRHY